MIDDASSEASQNREFWIVSWMKVPHATRTRDDKVANTLDELGTPVESKQMDPKERSRGVVYIDLPKRDHPLRIADFWSVFFLTGDEVSSHQKPIPIEDSYS